MDKEPTGEDLIFVNDGTDDDVFISGTTTQIYTESDGATMTMESYVPESDSGNLPIYIGVALLVIVIIAVGMYTAFKS